MKILILALLLISNAPVGANAREVKVVNELRTYMPYTNPIDPAKIVTTPDMDLSYALAATLVEWGPSKQIVSGLAKRWEITADKVYRLTLRDDAKWSNGDDVTSSDVKKAFERGFKVHPVDLRSLKEMLESIDVVSPKEVVFILKTAAKDSNLLGKLTEPNYGVVKVKDGGSNLDLSVTTGAYFVEKQIDNELVLRRNKYWHNGNFGGAEKVLIRQPKSNEMDTQRVLLEDEWPNVIQASSLMPAELMSKYTNDKYQVWKRPTDRIFLFQLSPRLHNKTGQDLFKFLGERLKRQLALKDFSGYEEAVQIFPKGYRLHDPEFKKKSHSDVTLPDSLKNRPLEILISAARVSKKLKDNIERAIEETTGLKPTFISVALQEVPKRYKEGNFDFYAGTVGLADPDPEGVMSFYFENEFKIIPSIGENFVARLDGARKEQDLQKRISLMRKMLSDSLSSGNVLPLFNLSTVGLARPELDLSHVPTTDESITLSKVRFKTQGSRD